MRKQDQQPITKEQLIAAAQALQKTLSDTVNKGSSTAQYYFKKFHA